MLSSHYDRSLVDWTCITGMFHHIPWQTLYIHWPTFQKRIFIHFLWRRFSAFSMAIAPAGVGVEAIVPPAKLKLLFHINELHFWRWMLSLEIYLVRYISAIYIYTFEGSVEIMLDLILGCDISRRMPACFPQASFSSFQCTQNHKSQGFPKNCNDALLHNHSRYISCKNDHKIIHACMLNCFPYSHF